MADPINTKKPTGLDAITTTLNRGSTGDQVKALQQYLIGMGYNNVKADGIYGPITEAAVKQFQLDNGVSSTGTFGPLTLSKAKTIGSTSMSAGVPGTGKMPDDPSNMYNTSTGQLNPKFIPKNQKELDAFYNASVASHPEFAGNDQATLEYAISTGDFSRLKNSKGQPFSDADQAAAVAESEAALKPGFDITKKYDTASTTDTLEKTISDYENWLDTQGTDFAEDKATLDKNAADQGVLFSGGRVQKENALGSAYSKAGEKKLADVASSIAGTARDYQYKYGDESANALSNLYKVGSNVYNPKVATGGVNRGTIKSVYDPTGGYQGTANVANKVAAQKRAAGLLWNKGNKLLSTSYKNQY